MSSTVQFSYSNYDIVYLFNHLLVLHELSSGNQTYTNHDNSNVILFVQSLILLHESEIQLVFISNI